jgi:hypothetical protein
VRPAALLTQRDRAILERLAEHEPLTTTELRLLFFTGARTCRARLKLLTDNQLLSRVYPARTSRGGTSEPLYFVSPQARRLLGAPARRAPGLSIPDLEHRRAVSRFFIALVERSLDRDGEGLYSWLGERRAEAALAGAVRPDGYGRYLLADGELTFYLELDRATEPTKRIADKLAAYQRALANDPHVRLCNIILVVPGRRRLASLARLDVAGPPWTWATIDGDRYQLLASDQQSDERPLERLPLRERDPHHQLERCLGRHWQLTNGPGQEATA